MTLHTREILKRELKDHSNQALVFFCAVSIMLIIAQMLMHYWF